MAIDWITQVQFITEAQNFCVNSCRLAVQHISTLTEPEDSPFSSQESAILFYFESAESSSHLHIQFLYDSV